MHLLPPSIRSAFGRFLPAFARATASLAWLPLAWLPPAGLLAAGLAHAQIAPAQSAFGPQVAVAMPGATDAQATPAAQPTGVVPFPGAPLPGAASSGAPSPGALPAAVQPAGAAAAPAAPIAAAAGSADDALRWFVEKEAAGFGRVEVRLGSLDPRLQLAPCRRIEPYVPVGARLWGRTAIGVRCVDGANWNVSLPVTVTVWGRALVAAHALAAGSAPAAADLRVQDIDLTREPMPPLTDPSQIEGRVLNRALAAGQTLRPDMLRVATTIQAGDPVRVVIVGTGFSANADGQALGAAGEGQPLRVRTETGRVLAGTVRGRTVEIRL